METFVQTFSDLIRDRLAELRLNAFAAENAAGLPPDAIRNVLRSEKQAGPTLARTKEICDALGLEIRIGTKQEMAVLDAPPVVGTNDDGTAPPSGFLTIPWHGAGPGSGSAPVAFSRVWLERHQLVPDFLQAILPDRYEISPHPGDEVVALIDTRIGTRSGPGLWCLREAGRVLVARMTFAGDQAVIHPTTPDGPARILDARSTTLMGLVGRVVWLGQIVPLKGKI